MLGRFIAVETAMTLISSCNNSSQDTRKDAQDAWVLRAGAELWKAVVAEGEHPAGDTQAALKAVREALDCARRLRHAAKTTEDEHTALSLEAARAWEKQRNALRQWGKGRGLNWETEWGTQWGEAFAPTESGENAPVAD